MNELDLYNLLLYITTRSKTLEGRFAVAKSWGAALNQENFGSIIKDALGGLTTARKYPAHIMMPPVELVEGYTEGWSQYRCVSLFVTTPHQSEGKMLRPNLATNQSEHTVEQAWKDMSTAAKSFRQVFNNTVKRNNLAGRIRADSTRPDTLERITDTGNDAVSGIVLTWGVKLFNPCTPEDYVTDFVTWQPPAEPHPQHAS